jgi:hypothetical protein
MIVKLKDNINIDKFLHMTFGTNNINECVAYYEYFSTENLKKPLNAKIINDVLYVDLIEADGEVIEMEYITEKDKSVWEVYE